MNRGAVIILESPELVSSLHFGCCEHVINLGSPELVSSLHFGSCEHIDSIPTESSKTFLTFCCCEQPTYVSTELLKMFVTSLDSSWLDSSPTLHLVKLLVKYVSTESFKTFVTSLYSSWSDSSPTLFLATLLVTLSRTLAGLTCTFTLDWAACHGLGSFLTCLGLCRIFYGRAPLGGGISGHVCGNTTHSNECGDDH